MFVFVQILATMANVGDLIADMKNLSPGDQQKLADALKAKMPDTTITSTVLPGPARLSTFSGEAGKGEVSFDQWRYEVKGLEKDGLYKPALILQTIRRSVRGTAADVLLTMGEDITVVAVVEKMSRIFGNILPPETILENFYSAKQGQYEKVAGWACRLEDFVSKLQDRQNKATQLLTPDIAKTMV